MKELQMLDVARRKFMSYTQQQKETELARLDDEIRRKVRRSVMMLLLMLMMMMLMMMMSCIVLFCLFFLYFSAVAVIFGFSALLCIIRTSFRSSSVILCTLAPVV